MSGAAQRDRAFNVKRLFSFMWCCGAGPLLRVHQTASALPQLAFI